MPYLPKRIAGFIARLRKTKAPESGGAELSPTKAKDDPPVAGMEAVSEQAGPPPTQGKPASMPVESQNDWTGRVPLTSIFPEESEQPKIKEAQKKLQDATEKLQAALQIHVDLAICNIDSPSVESAVGAPGDDGFERFLTGILETQSQDSNSVRHKASDFMKHMYPVASFALSIVSIGSSVSLQTIFQAAGIVPLTIVANSLNQICILADKVSKEDETAATQKLGQLLRFETSIKNIQALDLDDSQDPEQSIIVDAIKLLASMTEYLRMSVLFLKSGYLKKLGNAMFSVNNVVAAAKGLDEAANAFERSCSHTADFRTLEADIRRRKEDEEKELQKLSKVDYLGIHNKKRQDRCEGTTDWIFEQQTYKDWWAASGALWCQGVPGAGKTYLASAVIDWIKSKALESPGMALSYVYCDYGAEEETLKAISILKSIARQFIEAAPRRKRPILIQKATSFLNSLGPDRSQKSEVDFLTSITSTFQQPIVVIDALDECPAELAGGLTNRIKLINWLLMVPNLKLFVTSRQIEAKGTSLPDSKVLLIQPPWESIQTYITKLISERESLLEKVEKSSGLRTQIDDTVKSGFGEPLFITARLLIQFISPLPPGPIRDILKSAERDSKMTRATGDLHGTPRAHFSSDQPGFWYRLLIDRVKERGVEGVQVLAWVSFAMRRLRVVELQHAIAYGHRQKNPTSSSPEYLFPEGRCLKDLDGYIYPENELRELCTGLIEIKKGEVSFAHQTIYEYLQDEKVRQDTFIFDPQSLLATTCMRYLRAPEFKCGHCSTDDEFEERLASYPFYDYASHNWGHHCRETAASTQAAIDFLKSRPEVEASSQALMAVKRWPGEPSYSQTVPKKIIGLHLAAYFGLNEEVKALLRHGVETDAKDSEGWTPLWYAAARGHEVIVQQLLAKGAATEVANAFGWTPLWRAANRGHEAIVRLLLDEGAATEAADGYGQTPLLTAANRGHEAVVQLLLDRGAATEAADEHGWTPLSRAAVNGHEAVVQLLLDKGAATEAADEDGWTPLSRAAENRHEAVVQLLLDKGAAIEAANIFSQTPLFRAADGGHEAVVRLLFDKGAAIKTADKFGRTPLSKAAENGHEAVVRLLLDKGAAIEAADEHGQTPLLKAAVNGHKAIVQLLLDKGAATEAADEYGRTPLSRAAVNGHEAVVQLLLDKGAATEAADEDGQTPLSRAAARGHEAVVQLLLDKGADKHGWKLLSRAAENGHEAVVQLPTTIP